MYSLNVVMAKWTPRSAGLSGKKKKKWQKLNYTKTPSANNQIWLSEGVTGSGVFLAPFIVSWGILMERCFIESKCGQRGQRDHSGEARAKTSAQTLVLAHCDRRRAVNSLERQRKSSISNRETENTIELILVSYLGGFLSLQIVQIMRFKDQFKSSSVD